MCDVGGRKVGFGEKARGALDAAAPEFRAGAAPEVAPEGEFQRPARGMARARHIRDIHPGA